MSNLSRELSHYDIDHLHSFPFSSQSLDYAEYDPLGYLSVENQKLLPEPGEFSEKTANNLSIYEKCFTSNDDHIVIGCVDSPTKNSLSHDENENCTLKAGSSFNQYVNFNDYRGLCESAYFKSMALKRSSDPLAAAIASNSRILLDSGCIETTSSCYSWVSNEVEEGTHRVEQLQLFSEVDDGVYCIDSFGVHESRNNYNKSPYVGGDLSECSFRKKQCVITSPGKTKPKPSPSKDPQSIAAKNRRERISERLKILQDLVPNGTKVDLVTMLEKAISYVKFLQLQVKVLATDEFWPSHGGRPTEIGEVRKAIDDILSSQRPITRAKEGDD